MQIAVKIILGKSFGHIFRLAPSGEEGRRELEVEPWESGSIWAR